MLFKANSSQVLVKCSVLVYVCVSGGQILMTVCVLEATFIKPFC